MLNPSANNTLLEQIIQNTGTLSAIEQNTAMVNSSANAYTIFGEQLVEQASAFSFGDFVYGNQGAKFNEIISGPSTIARDNRWINLTSPNDASYCTLVCRRDVKYVPGQEIRARFTTIFENGDECFFGIGQSDSAGNILFGYFVGYHNSVFGFHKKADGVWSSIAISENLYDRGNIWQISVAYLGLGNVRLYYADANNNFVNIAEFLHCNQLTDTHIENSNFRILGYSSNGIVKSASYQLAVVGQKSYLDSVRSCDFNSAATTTTETHLISVRGKNTFGGVANYSKVLLRNLQVSALSAADRRIIQFRVYRNATITGGTWISLAADSLLETNKTATITNGKLIYTTFISGDSAQDKDLSSFTFDVTKDETLSVSAQFLSGSGDTTAALAFEEFI